MSETLLRQLCDRYAGMKRRRSQWHDQLQDANELILPNSPSFEGRDVRGRRTTLRIYDGTAPWALEMFAAGIHSHLTSPVDRWFQLSVAGVDPSNLSREELLWLEAVSDRIYHEYSLPRANFNPSLHEIYLSLGAFGTGALFQEFVQGQAVFRAYPLAACHVEENYEGRVDVVFRVTMMSTRQVIQQFPKTANNKHIRNSEDSDVWEVVHAVFPRTDRNPKAMGPKSMPYASYYFCEGLEEILDEGGYNTFPYHVTRWTKLAGEVYGRGPGLSVLPDIKMINAMSREMIFTAQMANSPPWVFDEDSMLLPVKNLVPKSILIKQQGAEQPQPLISGSDPNLSLELMEQRRDTIRGAFFVDFLLRPKKKERQTTLEIQDDRAEMLRQMGPMIARQEDELLGPMIARTYERLAFYEEIPEPPETLQNVPLEITYTSPAAKAQYGSKASAITQYIQDISTIGQFDPTALQAVDWPALLSELSRLRDVTRKVVKDPRVLKAEQEQAAQAQQAEMMSQQLPAGADAIKKIADARQADPTLLQDILPG